MPPRRDDETTKLIKEVHAFLAEERAARQGGVSVLRLTFPWKVLFPAVALVLGMGATVTANFSAVSDHMDNTHIHADEATAVQKNGIAYGRQVQVLADDVDRLLCPHDDQDCKAKNRKNRQDREDKK